jgi:diguanylate cyclase (GGDEF)-like protein
VGRANPPTDRTSPQSTRAERGLRCAPFAVVTALGVGAAFLPGTTLEGRYLPWCLAALGAAAVFAGGPCLFERMEGRATVVAAAFSYLAFVVLLVQAQGGTVHSGSFQLALLPIMWISLYGGRPEGSLVVVLTTAALVLVSELDHQTGDVVARKAGLWLLITAGLAVAIYGLRGQFARAMAERDQTVAQTASLSGALEELTALRHTEGVLVAGCRLAAQLASTENEGARRCTYFSVADGIATVVSQYDESGQCIEAAFPLDAHPPLKEVAETLKPVAAPLSPDTLGALALQAVSAANVSFGAFVPVMHNQRLHGVLGIAGRARPVNQRSLSLLVSLAGVVELALANAIAHQELERLAALDPLTGAVNRRGLEAIVSPAAGYVVIAADLDGLKDINDRYGHAAGDEAISRFADLLRAAVRPDDAVARVGGDEFNIVLTGAPVEAGRAAAERVINALYAEVREPLLRASLGIAVGLADDAYDQVARRADKALYEAKRAGGMRWAEANAPDVGRVPSDAMH